ncbi:hypothetical protein DFJ58DRAFT_841058, partial [Suillus subalutaceus]|uniref:uncharacterized protein n=1 Tax=Suillus subalutaceus TaxID=48586 RepID=UPI001B883E88
MTSFHQGYNMVTSKFIMSESPIIIPQQTKLPLTKGEVTVLRAQLEDWRSVKGKQRALVLNAIHKEAGLQAPIQEKVILKSRKKTYKEWLFNQCRWKGVPKPLIKYGRRWTEQTGETLGSEQMIVKWPKATKTILAGLSAEEKEEANAIAEKWNNEAAPPEVQANVAKTKGADMIEHFATEMFKEAGMRVFVLSAWQDGRGKLMVGGIHRRPHKNECSDTTEDQDVPQIVMSKKRGPQKLIELEEDDDGWPMLPETASWKRDDQQH